MKKDMIAEMELDMLLNGVVLKGVDFLDDESSIKVIHNGRPHTRAEKLSNDAKYRIKITGKKSNRDRKDYKMGNLRNEWNRDYRLYNGGYNGIFGSFKERKLLEKVTDEMENGLRDYEQLRDDEERIERVHNEIIMRTKKRVNTLQQRAEDLRNMAKNMLERAEELEKDAERIASSLSEWR